MIEPCSDITSGSTWCWRDNHCLPCHSATFTTTGANAHLDQQNSTQQTNETIEQNLGLTSKIPALQCCCCSAFTTAATTVCHSKQCGSKVDRYNVLKFPLKRHLQSYMISSSCSAVRQQPPGPPGPNPMRPQQPTARLPTQPIARCPYCLSHFL